MYKTIVNFQVLLERDTNITDIKRLKTKMEIKWHLTMYRGRNLSFNSVIPTDPPLPSSNSFPSMKNKTSKLI